MKRWIPVLFSVLLVWNVFLTVRIAGLSDSPIIPGTTIEPEVAHTYSSEVTDAVKRTEPSMVMVLAGDDYYNGFIIHSDEEHVYVVCRASLVGSSVSIVFGSGSVYEAAVTGADDLLDIAVIEAKPPFQAEPAPLGISDQLNPGEYVIALTGRNPQNQRSLTALGVTSRIGFEVSGSDVYEAIETDARLHNGTAGGVLMNLSGEIVGFMPSTDGKAVTIDEVRASAEEIIADGRVTRSSLGVIGQNVSNLHLYERSAWNLPLDLSEGVYIVRTLADSPAYGTLNPGDVIVGMNDTVINRTADLRNFLYGYEGTDPVQVTLIRDGERISTEIRFE
ncbi:MAG: PDZ domain-containing protein [Solobacterium sp.]|nr:PDZ domain-containing protein [Solobacterium sp.]